jgi:hypothetical protein
MYVKPEWGTQQITDINRRHVIALLDAMVDRGAPVMAKQTHSTIRKLFNWAVDRGVIPASLVSGFRRPPAQRIAIASSTMRNFALGMEWVRPPRLAVLPRRAAADPHRPVTRGGCDDALAGHRLRYVLDTSAIVDKENRMHYVPLAPAVMSILKTLPQLHDELVFTTNGVVPVRGSSIAKRRLDTAVAALRADSTCRR